jgi:hypothetical protein
MYRPKTITEVAQQGAVAEKPPEQQALMALNRERFLREEAEREEELRRRQALIMGRYASL